MSLRVAILISTGGWLLAATAVFAGCSLAGGPLERCVWRAASRPWLARWLTRFVERHGQYAIVLRCLGLAGLLLLLLPWWWRRVAGGGADPWVGVVLLGAPLSLWLVGDLVVPLLPLRAAAPLLVLALAIVEAARVLLYLPVVRPLLRLQQRARGMGAPAQGPGGSCLEADILALVRERLQAGGEGRPPGGSSQRLMIEGILALDRRQVREVMTPRVDVDALPETATVAEAKARINDRGHSRVAVYRETIDHITGVVHAKDLLDADRAADGQAIRALVRRAAFIPEGKSVRALLHELQQARSHFAVVLDEYGGTAGIVTLEDLLEEIIGEIRDEYDGDEQDPMLRTLADGSLVVDGRVPVADVADRLALESLVGPDYDTLGGFIVTHLGRIPAKGETLVTPELVCEVLEADARRVLRAKLTRRVPPPAAED